jgi:hypothetical protein
MSIIQTLQNYWAGMAAYDRCHPPTFTSQWQAFKSEASEFIESPSLVEAWDVLHSAGRLFWKLSLFCHSDESIIGKNSSKPIPAYG